MTHTAVITGSAGGIGAATAVCMAEAGASVYLVDRSPAVLETRDRINAAGGRAVARVMDVTDVSEWESAADECREVLGAADAFVSNAYTVEVVDVEATSLASWERQVSVNLTGGFLGFKTLLPQLREHDAAAVVFVSSVHAHFGLPGRAAYASTKAALTGLTRQLAVEYGPRIRVNSVLPGPVRTAAWDGIGEEERRQSAEATAMDRLGDPSEVGEAIAFLCSDRASFITGVELPVDGGWSVKKASA
ncbi:3-oxoacyl-ACP reductase [Microbacterium nanhaiense]|uniref:3-oxoacyl-ACP reductase n=1 Tax=Microbacterium nanhaiense TaxID=1301026 RepID=A0ABQ2N371_9MICO|nr:SDR family oxidoreductase [Microbacterium nanhaiense]GGO64954.1 3-oxoacyl-ACP reductase [Microbacterium nanhaiense]